MSQFSENGHAVKDLAEYYLPDRQTAYQVRRFMDCQTEKAPHDEISVFYIPAVVEMQRFSEPRERAEALWAFLKENVPDVKARQKIGRIIAESVQDPNSPAGKRKIDEKAKVVGESGRTYTFDLIMSADEIEPEPIEWLWEDRIPFGFLTVFAGRTGSGKSLVAVDIASRFTRGDVMPLGGKGTGGPGGVLIFSEDNAKRMLLPRLIASGANRALVKIATLKAMAKFRLDDQQMLEDFYAASGRPRLIIIDPPANFLKGKDENSNEEVRGILTTISAWSESENIAVILITHCSKGGKRDMAALDKVIGSVAWTSSARAVHLFEEDPEDEDIHVFRPEKNNVGKLSQGLSYKTTYADDSSKVIWTSYVKRQSEGRAGGENTRPAPRAEKALGWLKEKFREKMAWKSTELLELGQAAGHSRNALWEVKKSGQLDIRARQESGEDGKNFWTWYVMSYPDLHGTETLRSGTEASVPPAYQKDGVDVIPEWD